MSSRSLLLPDSSSEDRLCTVTANALKSTSEEATTEWKNDLLALFHDAKNRFPDIVWTTPDEGEVVWAHKVIAYVRDKGPLLAMTNPPKSPRAFSLNFEPARPPARKFDLVKHNVHRAGLDERYPSYKKLPKPPLGGAIAVPDIERRITTLESTLTQVELAKVVLSLYTVDSGPPSNEIHPIPFPRISTPTPVTGKDDQTLKEDNDQHGGGKLKLFRKELMTSLYRENIVGVWKDGRHTDIQVHVRWFGQEAIKHREKSVYRFATHRSILASRSPVLRNSLMGDATANSLIAVKTDADAIRMTLPYPPFTPASFYYILGYMYTGTIYFRPDRQIGLNTAFTIIRGSIFLNMLTLQKLVVAHIVVKMVHGLFQAYLTNAEYLRLVGESWSRMAGKCGCHCIDCMSRIPRVLQFALGSNIHSYVLQRGSRRALIAMFGLGWCTPEFASIPRNIRISILSNVLRMVKPMNALALLFSSQRGLERLDRSEEPWDITVRAMILSVRENVDEMLCKESRACFDSEEWRSVVSMDTPIRKDQLDLIMMAVLRATKEQQAFYITSVYQTFDSLEIPHTPGNFYVRATIEHIKCELLSNMAPMLSSSALSSITVSTHLSFVTAREEFDLNASQSHSPILDRHRQHTISMTSSNSEQRSLRTRSSTSSIYSSVSSQSIPWSLLDCPAPHWLLEGFGSRPNSEVDRNDSQSDISRIFALDLADSSTYSRASSRTISTDYGLFYTRHALSDWSMNTLSRRSQRSLRRRNSWDSLTVSVY